MVTHEEYDLGELEIAVVTARVEYMRATDRRDWTSASTLFNKYARLLHTLRLHKRNTS